MERTVQLTFPAWVVRCEQRRTLMLSNVCAAYQLGSPEDINLLHLVPGSAYILKLQATLMHVVHGVPLPEFNARWSGDFTGYHARGKLSSPEVPERHLWDLTGAAVLFVTKVEPEVPGLAPAKLGTPLWDVKKGAMTRQYYWGAFGADAVD